jgi:hypothetical protein
LKLSADLEGETKMGRQQETADFKSRRGFTKSLVATLAATPAIIGLAACKSDSDQRQAALASATPSPNQLPRKAPCAATTAGIEPHEPPIGFYDGSLVLNVPVSDRLVFSNSGTVRSFKAAFEKANYTSIQEVRVLTRPGAGRPFLVRYQLPPNPVYQLRIWLVQLDAASGGGALQNEYVSPGAEPQLILKATAPHLETEAKLVDAGYSHKASTPLRYDYPALARHFHIGKWQISDDEGVPVQDVVTEELFQDQGHDSYEIFVSFNHP